MRPRGKRKYTEEKGYKSKIAKNIRTTERYDSNRII